MDQLQYFNSNLEEIKKNKIMCKLRLLLFAPIGFACILFGTGCSQKATVNAANPVELITEKNWKFESTPMWEDNFSNNGAPDPAKWTLETGGGGWGNNELQFYTDNGNATAANGNLTITAKRENFGGREYTSARMITKGKGDFLYGRFEIRARLPRGRGTWPAIWMLHSNSAYGNWPASGEIDIMEHVGYDVNRVHATVHTAAYNHTRGTQKGSNKVIPTATEEFHNYRVDWTPYAVRAFIDDVPYFEFINENTGFTTWPFNIKFFMILNVAVGGNWGGLQGVDATIFPASMVVDYVRVYKMIPQ